MLDFVASTSQTAHPFAGQCQAADDRLVRRSSERQVLLCLLSAGDAWPKEANAGVELAQFDQLHVSKG